MNKLLGTTLMAAALTLVAGAAPAAEIMRETRAVDGRVSRIKLDGVVDLVVRQGARPSLVLSGERDDIAGVKTQQHGETLEIGTERRNTWNVGNRRPRVRAELTVPNLTEFVSGGVGASTVSGFRGEKIRLALDGAGSITLNGSYRNIDARLGGAGSLKIDGAKTDRMDLALNGAGQLAVTGQTRTLHATLGGVGNLDAEKLQADIVDLDLSGLGGATVHARSAIDVNLSGMGSATVYGKPARRNATTGGMGKVNWR